MSEIRTRDTLLAYTRFPGVPLQPLEHHSLLKIGEAAVFSSGRGQCPLVKAAVSAGVASDFVLHCEVNAFIGNIIIF